MNYAEKVFIDLMSISVFDENYELGYLIDENTTEDIIQIAKRHFCHTFIWNGLKICNVKIPIEFNKVVKLLIYRNFNNLSVQNKVIKILRDNGIDCVVLKGSSVSMCYKQPLLRLLGDIDILVAEKDFDKAVDILLNGQERNKKSSAHKFHYAMRFEGFSVEIHKHIIESEKENALSAEDVGEWIKEAQVGCLDKFEFPILKTEHQAVTLLLHMKRHMKENNINFRMLIDWFAFSNGIEETVWNENVYPQLKQLRIHKFADALMCLSDKYFKTDNSGKIHNQFSNEILEMFISDFFLSGFCDTTEKSSGFVAEMYLNSNRKNKILKIVDMLNKHSYKYFKISRYKILLPVCWLRLLVRYVFDVVTNKREKIAFVQVKDSVKRKEILRDELELDS